MHIPLYGGITVYEFQLFGEFRQKYIFLLLPILLFYNINLFPFYPKGASDINVKINSCLLILKKKKFSKYKDQ